MKRQPTTQQVTWFLDLYRNEQLDLEPPYQRKSVWSTKDRKFFLDTIFRNYPAPPVFIHRTVSDQGYTSYHVVDGKQRLETILKFFNNEISVDSNFGDINLDGKKFQDLTANYKRKFWDYTLVVDFIDSIDGKNIEEVFDRVNRNARNLQPQELRHARYNGWFVNFVENDANEDFWWDYKITTRSRDRRMKNVQFISELFIVLLKNNIAGFDQDEIDAIYAEYDDIDEKTDQGIFNLEDFTSQINVMKDFINQMNRHNFCIDQYAAGSNSNFYTLWGYIYINKPNDPIAFANSFADFMALVADVPRQQGEGLQVNEYALKYYNNSRGAATELPQRRERLNALSDFLA